MIVIIGAGLSGLVAARELLKTYPDLLVLEASGSVGGRVKQVDGVLPWPVQAGAEFVHGGNSDLLDLLKELGCKLREYEWPDYWYFGKERKLLQPGATDKELDALHNLFAAVGEEDYPSTDMSGEQWLRAKGATPKMLAAAHACYANDFGCSLQQLGLREMITENRKWDAGETYLILDRSLHELALHLARDLEPHIRLNSPVQHIQHDSTAGAVVTCADGSAVRCSAVVVTCPITQLQAGRLSFTPPLPASKQAAIGRVRMSNAVKVVLAFAKRFWPQNFFDIVCTDCFVPEFWVTEYPASHPCGEQLYGMTAFIAGEAAERISGSMLEAEVVQRCLQQLDEIFGTRAAATPATAAFVRAHVADWAMQPYINGAYTYPILGAEVGDREAIAAPVDGVVFFAGEATHPAINPCIQAALETGKRAATQVTASLQQYQSRL